MLLVLNCTAIEPIQLTGIGGQAILEKVASTNITYQTAKASPNDLWNWGAIPLNYALDKSGKAVELPEPDSDDNVWLASVSQMLGGLNTSKYT